MWSYISLGLLGGLALSLGGNYLLAENIKRLKLEVAIEERQLLQCGARLTNLIEDLESDNAIDNLPDSALISVPDHWLRPTGTAPGE